MFQKLLFRLLSSQYRFPSGIFGKYVGNKMVALNDKQNDWVISLLELKNNDKVLDIGCASGHTVKKIFPIVNNGEVTGLDPSKTMISTATERLRTEKATGRVKLVTGVAESCPFPDNAFTKIFAVHVVYFWKDLDVVFRELYRITKKQGVLAIYFVSPIIMSNPSFHEYSIEEIETGMKKAGFGSIQTKETMFGKQHGICILGRKK